MNLLLMQSGYTPASIKPENRLEYIQALEKAQVQQNVESLEDYYTMTYQSLIEAQEEILKLLEW